MAALPYLYVKPILMRLSSTLIFIFSISFQIYSQSPVKNIGEENVSRIINALSNDKMQGRPAMQPEVMEHAIQFVEAEFKAIGLKKLEGLDSYRQEFQKETVEPSPASRISVNNKPLSNGDFFLLSEQPKVNLKDGVNIRRVKKNQNLFQVLRQFRDDSTNNLIVVDTAHRKAFTTAQQWYSSKRMINKTGRVNSLVVILTPDSVVDYDIQVEQKLSSIKLTNIVGQISAKPASDEYVVFSAHYDHIGILKSVNGDSIANGADDDASGTTAVIELARYFNEGKAPRRNLVFVAFTAEEIGGYGSQYFSKQMNPDKVVAMFNIEMIGKPSKWGTNSAFITGFERSDFGTILQRNLQGTAFTFYPDPYPAQNLFYRSDNATLARLGVPAHTISTDQIDVDKFYHTVDDEVETLSIPNITATIRAIATSAASIAAGKDTPTRIDATKVN